MAMERNPARQNAGKSDDRAGFRFMKSTMVFWVCLLASGIAAASSTASSGTNIFDVRAFGASGSGKTLDTVAIQTALDACDKAGGGIVRLPAGTYLSKPIWLHSQTTLQLDAGAMLKATDERDDFAVKTMGKFNAFINGAKLTNVTISGPGTIDGSGGKWWVPAEEARQKKSGYTLPRPSLIVLAGCKNVCLENLRLQNSPKFHFMPAECEGVVVSNVTILAPPGSPNTDAIDPSSCKNVLITRCRIDVGDDNVAIKSSHKVLDREFASEDITVTDCTFLHGHGVSIGSETSGGVKNLLVKNCTFNGTTSGIRIKSGRDRGGVVENLVYRDLVMTNVEIPINITCYYPRIPPTDAAQPVTASTPAYRDIQISDLVSVSQRSAGLIVGLPESCISNVVLENVKLSAETGLLIRNAKAIRLKDVKVTVQKGDPFTLENAQVAGLEN
jgi:polygalacturonase